MQTRTLRRSLATILPVLLLTAARALAGGELVHFVLYASEPHDGAPKFVKFGPVHLVGQFGAGDYEVTKPTALGVPADKNGGGIINAETHLREFAIKQASGTSFDKLTGIRVVNQCNDVAVEVVKPVSLLVPSSKRLQAPAGPVPTNTDHYLCYQAKAKLPKGMQVEASDQFQSRRYDLKKLTKLCVPVAKSGNPVRLSGPTKGTPFPITPATIIDPTNHLLCYQAKAASKIVPQNECVPWLPKDKGTKFEPKQEKHTPRLGVLVTGQFGTEEVDTKNEVELCIPSTKGAACGDGMIQSSAGEQCDDGNTNAGDGCSAQCLIETVSPANEELSPCTQAPYSDFWTFDVIAGESVVVRADTTAASTAADLVFEVNCPSGFLTTGDDNFACTFPPPSFSCPEVSFTAPETGSCVVQVHNFANCASNTAAYALTVTRDNVAARLALRDDDACGETCATFTAPGTYPFTVPKGVTTIIVDVLGAQGGAGRIAPQGGLGGRTVSTLGVTQGDTLQINVGGRGGDADLTDGGAGGFHGGASGGDTTLNGAGGGGGGASDLRLGVTTLVVAGGGGGSGGGTDCCGLSLGGAGGAGGGTNGTAGGTSAGAGGGGASDTTPGTAGGAGADPGIAGFGGAGADGDGAGGGGGGGLYGGGGGAGNVNELGGGGGGGGSGFGPGGSFLAPGQRAGHGLVRIIVQ